jgi:chromosome segregation ATPase
MNEDKCEEIRIKLATMRSEARKMAWENRKLSDEIRGLQSSVKMVIEQRNENTASFESQITQNAKDKESMGVQQSQQREKRRRKLITEIRSAASTQKGLLDEVHDLEAEIKRIIEIYEAVPVRVVTKTTEDEDGRT